jgi:primosomal protein N'
MYKTVRMKERARNGRLPRKHTSHLRNESEPSAHRFLSRRLFDRGNRVEEEYDVAFFLSSWKRYLDEHDFVEEVY